MDVATLIDATGYRMLPAEIVVVVSNREDAYGLQRAKKAGIPTHVHALKPYTEDGRSRREYDADLAQIVKEYKGETLEFSRVERLSPEAARVLATHDADIVLNALRRPSEHLDI